MPTATSIADLNLRYRPVRWKQEQYATELRYTKTLFAGQGSRDHHVTQAQKEAAAATELMQKQAASLRAIIDPASVTCWVTVKAIDRYGLRTPQTQI